MRCSFCGKEHRQVDELIAGPDVYICNECVLLSNEIIADRQIEQKSKDSQEQDAKTVLDNLPKPADIYAFLDEYVIGQNRAKRDLAVAVYNHYKRLIAMRTGTEHDVEVDKSNVLLIGPTGCGKTYLAQTLARRLKVPFAVADATTLTEAGYVGDDVENVLLKIIQDADFDVERAQNGIIYIDEIDKIARKAENPSVTRDVSGEGVQQALLKILEGTVASVPMQGGKKHAQYEQVSIDTTNILFIVAGAFAGIEDIISSRIGKKGIGFGADIITESDPDLFGQLLPEDLRKFGLIPEFIGRLPVVTTVSPLDRQSMIRILTEPKNALVKQYQKLLALDGVKLEFDPDALEAIADEALLRETGARGLRSILEAVLGPVMFAVPSQENVDKVLITSAAVKGEGKPVISRRRAKRAAAGSI